MSPLRLYRTGRRVSWFDGLANFERWAVQYCRQMALAARVKRAYDQGRVSWDDALVLAKLIVADEATARRRIEVMKGRSASHRDGQLTEGFWRVIWKIIKACGLDGPVFPEDAAAAAIDDCKQLTGLTELADTRAVLDQQAQQEWWKRRELALKDISGPCPPT